jgi:hypothetical protein
LIESALNMLRCHAQGMEKSKNSVDGGELAKLPEAT